MIRHSILEYAAALRGCYREASKSEQGIILTEFCQTTGYHRKAAVRMLRRKPFPGTQAAVDGHASTTRHSCRTRLRSGRLVTSFAPNQLAPFLPELVAVLERHGELELTDEARCHLLALNPATIDRLLAPVRPSRSRLPLTQWPATVALKSLVPIRAFGEWQDVMLTRFCGHLNTWL